MRRCWKDNRAAAAAAFVIMRCTNATTSSTAGQLLSQRLQLRHARLQPAHQCLCELRHLQAGDSEQGSKNRMLQPAEHDSLNAVHEHMPNSSVQLVRIHQTHLQDSYCCVVGVLHLLHRAGDGCVLLLVLLQQPLHLLPLCLSWAQPCWRVTCRCNMAMHTSRATPCSVKYHCTVHRQKTLAWDVQCTGSKRLETKHLGAYRHEASSPAVAGIATAAARAALLLLLLLS